MRDVFDHFGTEPVRTPRGPMTRWKLFDCPWDDGKDALVGQEEVQAAVYRLVANFAREGRTNRLILLHGPNGSAKSTFVACLQRAMEHYSTLEDGALYKFNWIFPSQKLTKGGIGFGGGHRVGRRAGDLRLSRRRADRIEDRRRDARSPAACCCRGPSGGSWSPSGSPRSTGRSCGRPTTCCAAICRTATGRSSRRCCRRTTAISAKVLRHVQVERFFVSRRYRQAAATVEPQLAVDARSRQLTMDRSLASLPPALQSLTLYEYQGELVDGNRGVIDFADLLKRPLESYKYLLGTVEQGRVSLDVASLELDTVFIGSSNEGYLAAFKEIPEFQSFKGRMELVRVPYLLDYRVEQRIYEAQIQAAHTESARHVAPHVAWVTALWAVLTRMKKPLAEKYGKALSDIVAKLGPMEKAQLYADGATPEGLTTEQQRDLVAGIEKIARESDSYPNYEGRTGASPREMKLVIMNAAQSTRYKCLSPFAVFDELEELVRGVTVYEFLKQEPLPGGFHENRKFIFQVRDKLIDQIDDEVRTSMGLVEERRYIDRFERYVAHVSYWVKKEKVPNPITGRDEEPDEEMMADVERILQVSGRRDEFRREVISRIGAWSIDHPRQKPDYEQIFPRPIAELRDVVLRGAQEAGPQDQRGPAGAADRRRRRACSPTRRPPRADTLATMKSRFGYCDDCAKDAVLALVRKRYS